MTKPKLKLTRLPSRLTALPSRLRSLPPSGNSGKRIRGRRGVSIRARYLAEHPLCVMCRRLDRVRNAVIVDHVVPLALGGTDTDENKQGLCDECNRIKTAADQRAILAGGGSDP